MCVDEILSESISKYLRAVYLYSVDVYMHPIVIYNI